MNLFQAQAQIQSIRTLVDGGVKLDVITQELAPEDLTELFSLKGKLGWFLMKETAIQAEEIPTEEIQLEGKYKTPSQELRAAMYVYWRDQTNQAEDFNTVYYPRWMGKFKDKILESLD
jgi:hypothetical protein